MTYPLTRKDVVFDEEPIRLSDTEFMRKMNKGYAEYVARTHPSLQSSDPKFLFNKEAKDHDKEQCESSTEIHQ
jgi:hypothetical protein